jgi:hypothetical protein
MKNYIDIARNVDLEAYRSGRTPEELVMVNHGTLAVTYAPFDHINRSAELVLVGLTPGRTQASNAIEAMQSALRAGKPPQVALEIAKSTASFSGSMRSSLIAMLDYVGVPQKFGRQSASEFFEPGSSLVHFTSVLRYPVYLANGDNYSGAPAPIAHAGLRKVVETHLAEEAIALPNAIWIPLGACAEASVKHLTVLGVLDGRRVLSGLPHPSGANAERIAYFLGRKPGSTLSVKTNPDRINAGRERIMQQVAALGVQCGR